MNVSFTMGAILVFSLRYDLLQNTIILNFGCRSFFVVVFFTLLGLFMQCIISTTFCFCYLIWNTENRLSARRNSFQLFHIPFWLCQDRSKPIHWIILQTFFLCRVFTWNSRNFIPSSIKRFKRIVRSCYCFKCDGIILQQSIQGEWYFFLSVYYIYIWPTDD